nr:hypothetical protein [uncultured Lichenicoccus sp.]
MSPFGAEMAAGGLRALSSLRADADSLYWLEARPDQGRTVLSRCVGPGGAVEEVTGEPFDVGSRVHEYGGGAYAARDGQIAFSHRIDGSVWLIRPGCVMPTCGSRRTGRACWQCARITGARASRRRPSCAYPVARGEDRAARRRIGRVRASLHRRI